MSLIGPGYLTQNVHHTMAIKVYLRSSYWQSNCSKWKLVYLLSLPLNSFSRESTTLLVFLSYPPWCGKHRVSPELLLYWNRFLSIKPSYKPIPIQYFTNLFTNSIKQLLIRVSIYLIRRHLVKLTLAINYYISFTFKELCWLNKVTNAL